jgi:hypothetical protein
VALHMHLVHRIDEIQPVGTIQTGTNTARIGPVRATSAAPANSATSSAGCALTPVPPRSVRRRSRPTATEGPTHPPFPARTPAVAACITPPARGKRSSGPGRRLCGCQEPPDRRWCTAAQVSRGFARGVGPTRGGAADPDRRGLPGRCRTGQALSIPCAPRRGAFERVERLCSSRRS